MMDSSQEGSSEASSQASAEAKAAAAAAKKLKSLKLKVDGEEFEEELPFEIEDNPEAVQYLQRQLQLAKVSGKRMSEYTELRNDVNKFLELLQKDPVAALSDPAIGLDVKKFATQIIEQEIENSKKSPEQLEREKIEAELKALKAEREREKEETRKKELERLQQQEYERMDMLMEKALEKSELPKSPYVIKKIADYMLMGVQQGIDVTPEDVLPLVREEILDDVKQMFAVMPEEVVERVVGKDTLNKLRKKNLARARQAPQTGASVKASVKDVAAAEKKEDSTAQKKTIKELLGV
jgi:HD-GYP domain-containing protein (c-di-GMP phosphodiesterase class II)